MWKMQKVILYLLVIAFDMENSKFYVGRTNFTYEINCTGKECVVEFTIFVNDGFWDVDFVDEYMGAQTPDGNGPKLERFGGVPYEFIPRTIKYTFINPVYKLEN